MHKIKKYIAKLTDELPTTFLDINLNHSVKKYHIIKLALKLK